MPVSKVKKYTKSGAGELTDDQLDYLASGWCLDGDPATGCWIEPIRDCRAREWIPFESEAAMEAAWKKHKAEVVKKVESESSWDDRKIPWAQEVFENEAS